MSEVMANEKQNLERPEPARLHGELQVILNSMAPIPPLRDVQAQLVSSRVDGTGVLASLVPAETEGGPGAKMRARPHGVLKIP
jgi:hypothetical protein